MMRGIRGANTKPELRVRRRLHAEGLRFRLQARDLPGRPDLVFRSLRTAVFVHGCFWHQHGGCRFATSPASNIEFWEAKLASNVRRDQDVEERLAKLGWTVETIWECADNATLDQLARRIAARRHVAIGPLQRAVGRTEREQLQLDRQSDDAGASG